MDVRSIKYYDQNAARLAPEYHSAEVTGLHTLLGRWLPVGGEVLEIGCGAGRDAAFMASIGWTLDRRGYIASLGRIGS